MYLDKHSFRSNFRCKARSSLRTGKQPALRKLGCHYRNVRIATRASRHLHRFPAPAFQISESGLLGSEPSQGVDGGTWSRTHQAHAEPETSESRFRLRAPQMVTVTAHTRRIAKVIGKPGLGWNILDHGNMRLFRDWRKVEQSWNLHWHHWSQSPPTDGS